MKREEGREMEQTKKRGAVVVIGTGPGGAEMSTVAAAHALRGADVVYAAPRLSDTLPEGVTAVAMTSLGAALDEIVRRAHTAQVAVAVSGDTGIFSYAASIRRRCEAAGIPYTFLPGVSSLQCLFAALGERWDDAAILSAHGREPDEAGLLRTVAENRCTVVFCDPKHHPAWLCGILAARAAHLRLRIAVGENLSGPTQRVVQGAPAEVAGRYAPFGGPALCAVFNETPVPYEASRLRDADFIRAAVPMTRQEVRSAILDELELRRDSVVWDIGAGTGSVSVVCARACPDGTVYAAERDAEAVRLIRANAEKFSCFNLYVLEGEAPDVLCALDSADQLEKIPPPTHVFVGGSGGRLREILALVADVARKTGNPVRVVVSAVTVQTIAETSGLLCGSAAFEAPEVLQLFAARSRALGAAGAVSLLAGQNPVMLWSTRTKRSV